MVQFYGDNNEFSGSVLLAKEDRIVFNKSHGLANVEWNIPNTPSTKFRIGSVTKQFTAAAILLLEEAGKLKIDDPVKTYWPEAPGAWDKVTIFHLLTHTSGVTDADRSEYAALRWATGPVEETVGYIRNQPLRFEPGSQYSYSNSGYIVLGYLIERISGQSYGDFLRARIFTPLGMTNSGMDSNSAIEERRAAGYSEDQNGVMNAPQVNVAALHGAGSLYSTTEDLLRWTRGLFGGKLLSAGSLQKMTTPFKENHALGVLVLKDSDRLLIAYEGHLDGFNSALAYFPDEKVTIAVLANREGDVPGRIARQLGAILHGETVVLPSERREVQVAEDSLARFTGLYELDPDTNLIVTMSTGRLAAQVGSGPVRELFAETSTRFFGRSTDLQIHFEQAPAGEVSGIVAHHNGKERRGKRLPELVEVTVPAETLARYTGAYQLGPGIDVIITVEDGRLTATPTGQPKGTLYAAAEDRFFLKTFNAQVEFTREKNGQTTGLILHKAGQHISAIRRSSHVNR